MTRRYFLVSLLLAIATAALTFLYYARLPAQIPIHWNIHGVVDSYGAKSYSAFIIPAVMFGLLGLFRVLAWISPRSFDVDSFRPTYDYIVMLVLALLAYLQFTSLFAATHPGTNVSRLFLAGLFLFFAAMGNVLGKVRRNFWMGVRTPWTLASERVWNDTHRFAARLFVIVGLLGLVVVVAGASPIIAFAFILAAAVVSVGYSLVEYKQLEKRGEL